MVLKIKEPWLLSLGPEVLKLLSGSFLRTFGSLILKKNPKSEGSFNSTKIKEPEGLRLFNFSKSHN